MSTQTTIESESHPLGLILAPSRELCIQIEDCIKQISLGIEEQHSFDWIPIGIKNMKTCLLVGGMSLSSQVYSSPPPRRVDLSIETRSYDLYWNSRSNSRHSVQSTGSGVPEALWPPRRARSSLRSALFLCTRGGWSINQIFISHTIRISLFSLFMSFTSICTSIVVHWGIDHPCHRYAHRKPQTAHQNIHFQSYFYHRSWQYFFSL